MEKFCRYCGNKMTEGALYCGNAVRLRPVCLHSSRLRQLCGRESAGSGQVESKRGAALCNVLAAVLVLQTASPCALAAALDKGRRQNRGSGGASGATRDQIDEARLQNRACVVNDLKTPLRAGSHRRFW